MPVTVYRSSDSSAPTLSGTAGDLVNLLDKCLVAGYGSKAAAGWSKPFTGTNAAVFRMGGGNQFYLDVNDNAPSIANDARVRGYEAMTAVATGTAPFPTVAQMANGIFVRKSAAASGTTRSWSVVADDRTMYLLIQAGDNAAWWYCFAFGDFYSFTSGTDNFRTMIIGRITENSGGNTTERADQLANTTGSTITGHYVARTYTGLGGSIAAGKTGDNAKSGATALLNGTMPMPNPVDGNIWLCPVFVSDPTLGLPRGKLRGFMHFMHPIAGVTDQDTVTGAGVYAGHSFLLFKQSSNGGVYCIDVTGAWDTS